MCGTAGELSGGMGTGDSDADRDTLGIFDFAHFRLTVAGVKEETSSPHSRLACIHLKISLADEYRHLIRNVTVRI